MKKLNLNKQVVARLNNPENIYGGQLESYNADGNPNTNCFLVGNRDYSDPGLWPASHGWMCVSANPTFCANCDSKQCIPQSYCCAAQ